MPSASAFRSGPGDNHHYPSEVRAVCKKPTISQNPMFVPVRRMRTLRMVGTVLILIMTNLLAACGRSTTPSAPATSSAPPSTGMRTVVDMTGRHVQIPATVTRVATNIPLIPPTMYLLGGINKLVYQPSGTHSLLDTIYPSIKNIPTSPASSINDETLLKANPQVFIMTTYTQSLLPTLTRLKIPVVQIGALDNPASLDNEVNLVADVLGGNSPARAKQFSSYYAGNVAMVQAKTGSFPSASRPTVYYAPGPNPTTTVGLGNIMTASIDQAGGQNIAAVHGISQGSSFTFPTINTETLLGWNPQVIVAISPQIAQQFTSSPQYGTVAAVRSHRVYACPTGVFAWCASSAESALQPLWLAKTLHPDLFPTLNLATEVKKFYSEFYSYQLSDQQASTILGGSR
jgi:iron complex transport system substrate-binding protein